MDASRPDDSGDGASWATAKRTIQAAVDTAGTNHLVWVTNGVYAAGGATNASPAISNRVCLTKSITVQSVNGPSVTFIKGAADPSTGGLGTNATRCVYMSTGVLAGFTLTNGYTRADSDWNNQEGGGGALVTGGVISNCVVTTCVASHFGGGLDLFGGDAWNCVVFGNTSYDGGGLKVENTSKAYNCLIRGNNATHYGGGVYFWQSGLLANCTVAGNTATTNAGGVYCYQGGTNLNTIIYSNTVAGVVTNWVTNAGGVFVSSCTIPAASGTGNLTNNPLFVNLTAGDCRLQSGSPCVNAGANQTWMSGAVDLDGHTRILAGRVDMGAYEWVGAPLVDITNASATVYGGTASYTVSGTNNAFVMGTMWWTNQATTDQGTLAAASAWSIANVPLAFGTNTIMVSGTNEIGTVASDTLAITRLREFGDPSATHYVSPAGGHTWPYTNWLTAATNIQDAVDAASAGATVLVADGLYVTGGAVTPSPSYNVHLQSRVCVTRAVTVRSVDGPAQTFIVGAADPVTTNGPAAMRCVYLTNGAALSGFTLTNGHTTPSCNGSSCNYIYYSQNHAGGGAFLDGGGLVTNCVVIGCTVPNGQAGAESGSSLVYENGGGIYLNGGGTVVESVIRDNVAGATGGGVGGSTGQVSRCLVTNNVTSSTGVGGGVGLDGGRVSDSVITANFGARSGGGLSLGGQTGWATNCLIVGNTAGEYGGGLSVGVLTGAVYNCTIAGNTSGSTAGGIYLANQRLVTVFNSIIYGNTAAYSPNIATNSYTTFAFVCTTLPAVSGTGCFTNDPAFVNPGAGDYHLSAGSPCRNAGSNQGWMTNRTDLEGRARILEGTVDLGVYEFDPSHPPALVLNASAGAHGSITPEGNVSVPTGGATNFTITPDTYYHVADVTTNGVSVGAVSTFTWSNITANGTIAATFAPDLAANGTPHWWLAQYGWTNNFDTAEASDTDHDGFTAGQEYVADTNPTNAASYFYLTSVSNFPPWTVYFGSSSNRLYTLYSRTNLTEGTWLAVTGQSNIVGTGGMMSLDDTNAGRVRFYRVNVALP